MKLKFLIAVFLLSALTVSAQNPTKGSIVTNDGTTIHGVIDYRSDSRNAQECVFLKDGETEFKAYKPSEIKGYRLDEGAYYETRTLPVDSVPKTVFAECMIEGGMSLYFYGEGYEKYYYFVDDNGQIAELKCPGTNEANVDKSTKRKLMLAAFNMLSKSKKAQNELWASDFHRSALAKLTREYNNEFCHSNGNCVEYQYNPGSCLQIQSSSWKLVWNTEG